MKWLKFNYLRSMHCQHRIDYIDSMYSTVLVYFLCVWAIMALLCFRSGSYFPLFIVPVWGFWWLNYPYQEWCGVVDRLRRTKMKVLEREKRIVYKNNTLHRK